MDSYNFTYKDVLKRYERIINKPSKLEIRLLATILLIITIVNITSLCFAAEPEQITPTTVSNIQIQPNSNAFVVDSSGSTGYVECESGYRYILVFEDGEGAPNFRRAIAYSNEIPALNVPYTFLTTINKGESYYFIPPTSDTILYFTYSPVNNSYVKVYREKLEGQQSAVNDLVENVGISQLWDIFDTGIGFVGVVVLVAFGIFLIVLAIKKVSKGKSEF